MSRLFTVFWGVLALLFAIFAAQLENLIQAVNIIGSVFYGPILGIFMVAFLFRFVKGSAVFIGAILGEVIIVWIYLMTRTGALELGYLWLNLIGAVLVIAIASFVQLLLNLKNGPTRIAN